MLFIVGETGLGGGEAVGYRRQEDQILQNKPNFARAPGNGRGLPGPGHATG